MVLGQDFHLTYGITTLPWDGNIFSYEKTKLTLSPPTTTHHRLPSAAALYRGIFENIQNILGNSIRLPNALKNT